MPAKMAGQEPALDIGGPTGGIIDQNDEGLARVEGFLGG